MLKPAVIGKDGRTTAIIKSLERSPLVLPEQVALLSEWKDVEQKISKRNVLDSARRIRPDFVVVGPEEPLAVGIVNLLQEELGIPCIGPTKALARLESSKAFTRELLSEFKIPGNPEYRVFRNLEGIEEYLHALGGYVVKPDGLTGGKGVKVSDAHLFSVEQAMDYCGQILDGSHEAVVIEEKLDGEEFSLMSFCDGVHVRDMVPVQDHKRAHAGDTGPNTGGMGSYSCEDHLLPFLTGDHLRQASEINAAVARALHQKTGEKYKGIIYGGFMITAHGLRLLEYNARFGDPETMNVLSILETDLAEIFQAIIAETLHKVPIRFKKLATVCKYVVPNGYPDNPVKDQAIDLSQVPPDSASLRRFKAAIKTEGANDILMGSRAIAFVGIGRNVLEAEHFAEEAAAAVQGPVFHRSDIGTPALIKSRIQHIKSFL
jgi:phosphoribosylamine---glycine ligase